MKTSTKCASWACTMQAGTQEKCWTCLEWNLWPRQSISMTQGVAVVTSSLLSKSNLESNWLRFPVPITGRSTKMPSRYRTSWSVASLRSPFHLTFMLLVPYCFGYFWMHHLQRKWLNILPTSSCRVRVPKATSTRCLTSARVSLPRMNSVRCWYLYSTKSSTSDTRPFPKSDKTS